MEFHTAGDPVVVLDGGLATELEAQGHDLGDALWSARLLADDPDAIVAAHRAFFRAGAAVATTASYQASFDGLAARGVDRAAAAGLLRRSVELARDAAASAGGRRWVAASVGPYGAVLADGSEYRGRYGLSVAALDVPAWLSYSIDGERTRAGQPLADAFAVAAGVPQIVAVGVNCCAPADVPDAVALAREITGKPVIAYPNSGEGWDARARAWTGPPRSGPEDARRWVAEGARIVGGCCRVGPAGIARLAEGLGRS